jgi:hypothetical protein
LKQQSVGVPILKSGLLGVNPLSVKFPTVSGLVVKEVTDVMLLKSSTVDAPTALSQALSLV